MYTMSKIKFIFPLYSILGTLDTKYVTKKKNSRARYCLGNILEGVS